jgi:hypothetical protein
VLGSWVFRRDVPEEIHQSTVVGYQFSVLPLLITDDRELTTNQIFPEAFGAAFTVRRWSIVGAARFNVKNAD